MDEPRPVEAIKTFFCSKCKYTSLWDKCPGCQGKADYIGLQWEFSTP